MHLLTVVFSGKHTYCAIWNIPNKTEILNLQKTIFNYSSCHVTQQYTTRLTACFLEKSSRRMTPQYLSDSDNGSFLDLLLPCCTMSSSRSFFGRFTVRLSRRVAIDAGVGTATDDDEIRYGVVTGVTGVGGELMSAFLFTPFFGYAQHAISKIYLTWNCTWSMKWMAWWFNGRVLHSRSNSCGLRHYTRKLYNKSVKSGICKNLLRKTVVSTNIYNTFTRTNSVSRTLLAYYEGMTPGDVYGPPY